MLFCLFAEQKVTPMLLYKALGLFVPGFAFCLVFVIQKPAKKPRNPPPTGGVGWFCHAKPKQKPLRDKMRRVALITRVLLCKAPTSIL